METNTLGRYTITKEPWGDVYRSFLRLALDRCDTGILVRRRADKSTPTMVEFLKRVHPFVISAEEQSRWPGTELIGHKATVIRFRYGEGVIDELVNATSHLYGWIEPELPEDLCLIRPDGRPWLVSISHEKDSYLDLDQGEHRSVVGTVSVGLVREHPLH